jgi:hypothetical protein
LKVSVERGCRFCADDVGRGDVGRSGSIGGPGPGPFDLGPRVITRMAG